MRRLLVVLAAMSMLLSACNGWSRAWSNPTPPTSPTPFGVLLDALQTLVGDPDPGRAGYDRDLFFEGADLDGDCVRTRHEVLQEEAVTFTMAGCTVVSGVWADPFTAKQFGSPTQLEMDHVVALADAWRSGAWAWTDTDRRLFANDPANLNMIEAAENQRKSDLGPAGYRPANDGHNCAYVVQYAEVKVSWGLSVTAADYNAVANCATPISPAPVSTTSTMTAPSPVSSCHPAYSPCLANLAGNALNCGDLNAAQKPVTVLVAGVDPYRLDGDANGVGCQ